MMGNEVVKADALDPQGPVFEKCKQPLVLFKNKDSRTDRVADERIVLDTIHDGYIIPIALEAVCSKYRQDARFRDELESDFMEERDWGAHWVASALARRLGLRGYYRNVVARSVFDFGRFPGVTTPNTGHLSRLAINEPLAGVMPFEERALVLKRYYDGVASKFEEVLLSRLENRDISESGLIKISIHTYDEKNASGTRRPLISLITRPESYQLDAKLFPGTFDKLFPQELAEFTVDRALVHRLALVLERNYLPTAHNFPYLLPEGSVELRTQVWFFFHHLRRVFEADKRTKKFRAAFGSGMPVDDDPIELVWKMLQNTNSRSVNTLALRAFLDKYSDPPAQNQEMFLDARRYYRGVMDYLHNSPKSQDLVRKYRYSPRRPGSLAVEIRKDFLWEGNWARGSFIPRRVRVERAEAVAECLAKGISDYVKTDLKRKRMARKRLEELIS